MLPNDGISLVALFGSTYEELHGLTSLESSTVEVLVHARNFSQTLPEQLQALRKQLNCLERIHDMALPNQAELEKLARVHRNALQPYIRFQTAFKGIWNSLHENLPAEKLAASLEWLERLTVWTNMQREFNSEVPFLNDLHTGLQTLETFNRLSSLVLGEKVNLAYKDVTLKASETLTVPGAALRDFAKLRTLLQTLLNSQSVEADFRSIYFDYAALILKEQGVQFAELMLRQDLNLLFDLAANYFQFQLIFTVKMHALTDDPRFLEAKKLAIEGFRNFAQLIPFVGVPLTLAVRSCQILTDLKCFETSHKFIQTTKQRAHEAYWPIEWLGFEPGTKFTEEQRELLAKIPNPQAKLWVERALENATGMF